MTGFDGKVAIVTGGGSGLGEAIGEALARRGVKVVLSDINLKGAERVAAKIRAAGGTAGAIEQNTAKAEDSEKVVNHAMSTFGALHYAVNNAGIGGNQAPAGETDLADWNRVIDINLNGVLYGMRYQIPAMLKTGARDCAIVNTASIHGTVAAIGNGAYTAAKHGVVGLTKNAAAEYGSQGLRINCVGPVVQAARAVAANTPVQLAAARQSEAQAAARYQAGLASIVEVTDAQGLLAQAEVQDQLARIDVWRALLMQSAAQRTLAPFLSRLNPSAGAR